MEYNAWIRYKQYYNDKKNVLFLLTKKKIYQRKIFT